MNKYTPKLIFLLAISLCLIVFTTCKKLERKMLVSTGEVTNILIHSADVSGLVVDIGDGATQRGHCYGTSSNVNIDGLKTQLGAPSGPGGFTSQLTNLDAGTKYYIKAYLTDGAETVYGKEINFTTSSPTVATLTTTAITSITTTTAASGGDITSDGGSSVTARGVCWKTSTGPTINNNKTTDASGTGSYSSSITGLTANTTYYVRAYATNSVGTAYGDELSFTTAALVPTLTTKAITEITQTTATGGGNITDDGGAAVTARGVCWSTGANPTTSDSKTTNGTGSGSFSSSITGLTANTTYYVRAYATNSVGTAYGNELTFNTSAVLPSISTLAVTLITTTSASSGGNISSDGGSAITVRGVCWSTSTAPTTANSKTTDGSGTSSFISSLTGLKPGTTYYVRAYATNSVGTAYGNEVTFTTSAVLPTLTTAAITSITTTTATSGGNISSDGGAVITARGVCWNTSASPATSNNKTTDGSGTGSFVSNLSGLTAGTTYYVRAYATNSVGTAYGDELSFIATPLTQVVPTLSTTAISEITQTSAISGGNIISDGGASVTVRGVCWSTATNPTISNSITSDGSGIGSFVSNLSGLAAGTIYYIRAYATNIIGTAYGNELSFTTSTGGSVVTLTTTAVSAVTSYTAISGGNILSDGGAAITQRGVCWNTATNPNIFNSITSDGSGTGSFVSNLTGLEPGTTYYVRAYAFNSAGFAYGNEVNFRTQPLSTTTVSDIDGNSYKTVTIGTQVWMKENLKTTRYRNSDPILTTFPDTLDIYFEDSPKYQWAYEGNESNVATYGRLYTWYAATDIRGVCPVGWHVPTYDDWITLSDFLGGDIGIGDKMKEAGTDHWEEGNLGTNSSGLTALPGGWRNEDGYFLQIKSLGGWWDPTDYSISDPTNFSIYDAQDLDLFYNASDIYYFQDDKCCGFSVRCVQD